MQDIDSRHGWSRSVGAQNRVLPLQQYEGQSNHNDSHSQGRRSSHGPGVPTVSFIITEFSVNPIHTPID